VLLWIYRVIWKEEFELDLLIVWTHNRAKLFVHTDLPTFRRPMKPHNRYCAITKSRFAPNGLHQLCTESEAHRQRVRTRTVRDQGAVCDVPSCLPGAVRLPSCAKPTVG